MSKNRNARVRQAAVPKAVGPAAEAVAKLVETAEGKGPEPDPAPPANENPTPPAPQRVVSRRVVVFYNFWRKDGSTGTDRAFINDVLADIRTKAQLEATEAMILARHATEYIKVFVFDWKPLEG